MEKKLLIGIICFTSFCITFSAGYCAGNFTKDSGTSGSSSDYSYQFGRIVELTREYITREREGIAGERRLIEQQRNQLERDRAELERERTLFARQRDLVVADRADLEELAKILENIRDLAQDKK